MYSLDLFACKKQTKLLLFVTESAFVKFIVDEWTTFQSFGKYTLSSLVSISRVSVYTQLKCTMVPELRSFTVIDYLLL